MRLPEIEVVTLNQQFTPLGGKHLLKDRFAGQLSSVFKLQTDELGEVVVVTRVGLSPFHPLSDISPFDPEQGYIITEEDFEEESRRKKLQRLASQADQPVNKYAISLHLRVNLPVPPLERNQFQEYAEKIEIGKWSLRTQLSFPRGIFEGRAVDWTVDNELMRLGFTHFYHLDIGQLPPCREFFGDQHPHAQGAFRLSLPVSWGTWTYWDQDKLDRLSEMKARFVLLQIDQNPGMPATIS